MFFDIFNDGDAFYDVFQSYNRQNPWTVRNLFEKIIINQANRLADIDVSDEEMRTITVDDLNEI